MRAPALLPSRVEGVAALASAALFAVAFPPFPLVVPALLCLAPLAVHAAHAAGEGESVRAGARVGFWFGVLGYGANIYWIASALSLFTRLAFLAYVGALLVVAMVLAGVGAALVAARRATRWPMALLLPLVWVAGEVALEHLGDLAFPWLPLGLSVARVPLLAQLADVSGVHGLTAWMAATSGLAADAWLARVDRRAVARRAGVAAALAAIVAGYGAWRMRTVHLLPVATVAVVQPDIPQEEKWQDANRERIVGILAAATRRALAGNPKLVVWPETALPDFLFRHPAWNDSLVALTKPARTPLLAGVLDVRFQPPRRPDYFNGAMLVDGDGVVRQPVYHKRQLVPVVERVPFVEPRWFRGLGDYFGGYGRGRDPVVFDAPIGTFGVMICYESVFPAIARDYRRRGAEFLVSITNDAWFGRTTAPYQHFAHLALRAIETRASVVRAANTGVSGYVDPLGRVQGETPLFVAASPRYLIDETDAVSPFVRLGDWVGWGSLLATLGLVVAAVVRRRRVAPERAP